MTALFLPSLFQEKNLGPSRRSPRPPRPPGASRGGRAGVGRAARSWEDSSGEQPRGGAGGRGRGSPHLSGAGDVSAADRRSKVGARSPRVEALPVRSCPQMDCFPLVWLPAAVFFGPCVGSVPPLPSLALTSVARPSPCLCLPLRRSVWCTPAHPPSLAPSRLLLPSACALTLVRSLFPCVSLPGFVHGER